MFDRANTALYKGKYRIPSARLKGWDYSSCGYYYVTICTKNKTSWFGNIVENDDEPGAKILLSPAGEILEKSWHLIPEQYSNVSLNTHQIMPNHFHGILSIEEQKDNRTLGVIINQFKSRCTTQIRESGMGEFSWQARFHDHVIRNEKDLERVRRYINENPATWLMGEDESQTRIWG